MSLARQLCVDAGEAGCVSPACQGVCPASLQSRAGPEMLGERLFPQLEMVWLRRCTHRDAHDCLGCVCGNGGIKCWSKLPATRVLVVLADGARQQLSRVSCYDPIYRAVISSDPKY